LIVRKRAARWGMLVALNVPTDDVLHVLQSSERLKWMREALGAVTAS
jgi:hypothetical protein